MKVPCGNKHCKSLQTIHADSGGRSEKELISLFRAGFFRGELPCGHPLSSVPERFYKVRRILERLW
jgi:hypothetical protein